MSRVGSTETLLAALADRRPQERPGAALRGALDALLEAACAAWPELALETSVFVRHVAERLPAEGDLVTAIAAIHAADLYLTCACAHGDPRALRLFDERFVVPVTDYLRRADALPGIADDVKQELRTRLLMPNQGLAPRIAAYAGRGPLGAWLRVTATREALRLRGSPPPQGPAPEELDLPGAAADPDLEHLKAHYGNDLRGAFESTLAALEARDGAVLRLYYLEGASAQAIGGMYGVSARTVQRWIIDVRSRVLMETHRRLAERLNVPAEEIVSLLGLLRSQLDVSIWRHLA